MDKFDVILVLGRGIYQDGSIPDSAKATIDKAVELFNKNKANYVIFSGKWSYKIDYIPPTTEAEAMANHAKSLGLPDSAIILEKDSVNTMFNVFNVKKRILEPKKLFKVILVSLDPVHRRAFNDLKKMLGPKYLCELIIVKFNFSDQKYKELKQDEEEKFKVVDKLYSSIPDGDDQAIYYKNIEFIKKNYPNFKF